MVRIALAFATSLLASFAVAAPNSNKVTLVNLRIEGENRTIFEGPISTKGHDVETTLGGKHHCDGTNLGANPTPGPTCTSALDDAARLRGFNWDGAFFEEFDDYLVQSIAGENQNPPDQFWAIYLNFQLTPVGGCQQQVKLRDEVLFGFDGFSKAHILKLSGPHIAKVGKAVVLTVTDGGTGAPIAGANVNGNISDANGHISITFGSAGVKGVKAEKADSLRSNKLEIVVVPQ